MSKQGSGRHEAFWLWTGDTEYDGHILSLKGTGVTARIRRCSRRIPVNGAVGTVVPTDVIERQRQLARRIGFAQSPAVLAGSLTEFRIVAIQPSQDPEFDFVVSGMFWPIAEEHLEKFSQLDSDEAFQYLQANSSRAISPSKIKAC